MKRYPWLLGMLCMLMCAAGLLWQPVRAEAASQSDREAYSTVFDADYYYNTYPDVAAEYGRNDAALYEHFLVFGVAEGRSASAEYNPQAYRTRYADLQAAYGNDMTAYCRHYVAYGRAEGRIASADGQRHARAAGISLDRAKEKNETEQVTEEAPEEEEVTEEAPEEEEVTEEDPEEEAVTEEDPKEEEVTEEASEEEEVTEEAQATDEEDVMRSASKAFKDEESLQFVASTGKMSLTANVENSDRDMVGTANQLPGQIGTCTTYYETGVSRATNVELAAERVNGVVLQPGESFSFSRTILDRTRENGYVEGPIYVKGKTEMGIGGGVCQVSSTLYAAMVDAGLPATERHAHSKPVDYLPQGLDATIAGNYLDLKFTNIYDQPLCIVASATGGELSVVLVLQ